MDELKRRIDVIERNQSDQARSMTGIVEELNEMRKPLDQLRVDREVRKERDKNLNERLDRIEDSIAAVYSLGKWLLATIGAVVVVAAVTFMLNGGLNVGH